MAILKSGVIFNGVDTQDPHCWTLESYVARGGYEGLKA